MPVSSRLAVALEAAWECVNVQWRGGRVDTERRSIGLGVESTRLPGCIVGGAAARQKNV